MHQVSQLHSAEQVPMPAGGVMTPAEILIAARALIAEEKSWCQGALARNAAGVATTPYRPGAVAFCSVSAIDLIGGLTESVHDAYAALALFCDDRPTVFNDSHTHAEVLDAYDKAIALLN